MATKSWYLTATTGNSWRTIDEATQTAATNTDGWVVSTGTTNHSEYFVGVERAASTFTGTTVPDGTLDTTNRDAFRTTNAYTGDFANANWTFTFVVRPVTSATSQTGAVVFRLFRSANADGTGATQITSAQQTCSTTAAMTSTATDYTSSLTLNPGAITLNNEYLFIQIAWKRVGAGGMTSADANWRTGSSSTVGTRIVSSDFTPQVNVALTGSSVGTNAGTLGLSNSLALTGTSSTVSAGTVSPGIDVSVALSGAQVTSSAGTLGLSSSLALSGEAVTTNVGTLSRDVQKSISGEQVTTAAGTLTPESGTSIALSGASVSASAGTLGLLNEKALSGSQVTSSAGTLGRTVDLALSGSVVSIESGTVGISGDVNIALTGSVVAVVTGNVSPPASEIVVTGAAGGSKAKSKRRRKLFEVDGVLVPFETEQDILAYLDNLKAEKVQEARKQAEEIYNAPAKAREYKPRLAVPSVDLADMPLVQARVSEINNAIHSAYAKQLALQAEIDDEEALLVLL